MHLAQVCGGLIEEFSVVAALNGVFVVQAHIQLNNSSAATESLDTVEKLISEAEDANVDDLSSKVQKLRDRVAKLHKAEVIAFYSQLPLCNKVASHVHEGCLIDS